MDFSDPNDVKMKSCVEDGDINQQWFEYYNDLELTTVQDGRGNCLNGQLVDDKMNLVPCDYCNDNLLFIVDNIGINEISFKNKVSQKYLNLSAPNVESEVVVSVFFSLV